MFRKFTLGLTVLISVTSGALAAPAFTWTGAYVGLNVGGAWSNFRNLDAVGPNCWWCANNYGRNESNIVGGGQIGYNFQMDNSVVLGLEAQIGRGLFNSATHAYDPTHLTPDTSVSDNVFGVAAARVGYSFGQTMIYAKGGLSVAQINYKWVDPTYSAWASNTKTTTSGVFGAGVEYQISPQISLKAEYLRVALSGTNILIVQNYAGGYVQRVRIGGADTFTVGANFRFGGP